MSDVHLWSTIPIAASIAMLVVQHVLLNKQRIVMEMMHERVVEVALGKLQVTICGREISFREINQTED